MSLLASLESQLLARLGGSLPARLADRTGGLFRMLEASDRIGKAAIVRAQTGQTLPLLPGGQSQMAFVLYWMGHEPAVLQRFIAAMPELVQTLWGLIDDVVRAEYPSSITPQEYAWAQAQPGGIVAADGSILGNGPFQDFDDEWLWALFNYLVNLVDPGRVAPFLPPGPPRPFYQPLQLTNGQARIALVGDWGTGPYNAGGYDPATSVMRSVMALQPDYLIHLGDVYYAGTQDAPPPFEENRRFLEQWPPTLPAGRSFTLNSNHEMYGGANGYFNVALGRGAATPTPFAHQNGCSFFALSCGNTAIVGLDAAYFDPSSMYMDGGLGTPAEDPQFAFLQSVAADHTRLILLTHQTAMSMDGTQLLPLWNDVSGAIDASKIALWYWGHIHAGIAYDQGSAIGALGVRAGCCGHGAIPMGAPWGLQQQGRGLAWVAQTPVGGGAPASRVRNGFALLTLGADGRIGEAFYDAGNPQPAWTRG